MKRAAKEKAMSEQTTSSNQSASPRRISVPVLVKEENATKGSSSTSSSAAGGEGKLGHHRDTSSSTSSSSLAASNTSSLLPSHLTCDPASALDPFRSQGSATPVSASAFPSMTPLHHNANNAYLHHQRAILTPVARNGASLRGRGGPRTSPGEHANRARRPTGFSVEDACH
ncbi:hypothetical protein C7M84_012780 [Penaeus vannamei]|uniref:Uncharacterized protein n=1 Tax=Penaeus vannamei TaxID=6689 RepID=A0A423SXY5_PENVA|nr:hypothetical protein C7M84_012780 [Penaeus vannamei]